MKFEFKLWLVILAFEVSVRLILQGRNDMNMQNSILQSYVDSLGEVKVRKLLTWLSLDETKVKRLIDLAFAKQEYDRWEKSKSKNY